MNESDFYSQFGFTVNPFRSKDADQEDGLRNYFVPPKYFRTVKGNPTEPKTEIVFAPRGTGKSAQRIILEEDSASENVLCINYTDFNFPKNFKLDECDKDFHLSRINRLSLLGILTKLATDDTLVERLDVYDKDILKAYSFVYLGTLTPTEIRKAINSLKNFSEKALDFWNQKLTPLSKPINLILSILARENIAIDSLPKRIDEIKESVSDQFSILGVIAVKIGFNSVYVLIDRVDETEYTGNDATASYKLIESLLRDIKLLETKNYAFKFFLWDRIKSDFQSFSRPDRITPHTFEWTADELFDMINKRVAYFSSGKCSDFTQLFDADIRPSIPFLIRVFSMRSPRDMLTLLELMCREQIQENLGKAISKEAVERAIDSFCEDKVQFILDITHKKYLKQLEDVEFTTKDVSRITKNSDNDSRNKINKWKDAAFVDQIGNTRIEGSAKPIYQYAFSDSRAARVACSKLNLGEFLRQKYVGTCKKCDEPIFRFKSTSKTTCHRCSSPLLPKS